MPINLDDPKNSLDLRKLAEIPTFFDAKLSTNEDKLSFYWNKTGRLEFYIMDLETKEITQISDGEFPDDLKASYIWSKNDEDIIFAKDHGGDENYSINSFNLETKKLVHLTDTPKFQEYIYDISQDGETLIFTSNRNGPINVYSMSSDGSNVKQITAHERSLWIFFSEVKMSPDGKFIAYTTNEENDPKNQDIHITKTNGDEVKRIVQTKIGSQDNFTHWSKDGKHLIFTTDVNGNYQGATYNNDTKEIIYYGSADFEEYAVRMTNDNKKLICLRNKDSSVFPVVYDLQNGEEKILNFPEGIAIGGQVKDNRYLILNVNQPKSPSRLITYDLEQNKFEILQDTNMGDIDPSSLVDSEYIWYRSTDDVQIPAIIYKPKNYSKDKLYPGIIYPHGGPTGQYFNQFLISGQYLADNGYVVIYPNVRGSTGYGVEFRDSCLKDWGGKDLDDWVAARDWLIQNAQVDPNRVGICGGSYGGYATLISITKRPELWKAAVSAVPISHLRSMYENHTLDHFKQYFFMQMGDPIKNEDLWEDRSPLNFVENLQAKLLLLHGLNDPRCPVEESRNVVDKLKELGKIEGPNGDYQYIEWEDIGHGKFGDFEFAINYLSELTSYFNRHL
ncbi:MAG: Acylamino-acid-releasing enzyme [Candidatus Heimdallarchaeota archaeon LC_2]|nr:MAG: Acylamino-acid-releasing enzyme [Candidatus Heimdallarchaeota archaeon LC_2]